MIRGNESGRGGTDAYLELMLPGLSRWTWIEEIDCKNLNDGSMISQS